MKRLPLLLALVASLVCAERLQPLFKVELSRTEDSVEVTATAQATVITIDSKRGIGTARLIRTGEEWPARLILRLTLQGLESFKMDNGRIRLNTFLKGSGQTPYWRIGTTETPTKAPDGMLAMTITATDEAVEIVVPPEMRESNPETIRFAWIDFFRR